MPLCYFRRNLPSGTHPILTALFGKGLYPSCASLGGLKVAERESLLSEVSGRSGENGALKRRNGLWRPAASRGEESRTDTTRMLMWRQAWWCALLLGLVGGFFAVEGRAQSGYEMLGERKRWHPVTIQVYGPQADEQGDPNPFLDYRFNVEITAPDGTVHVVPGFFLQPTGTRRIRRPRRATSGRPSLRPTRQGPISSGSHFGRARRWPFRWIQMPVRRSHRTD